jgi:flagellar biosynthesis protein FlhG
VKPLSEQDHYEALDVQRGATREEIERAYHLAKATYADDSLAGYSAFEEGDAALMRERIELAYRTLSDSEVRRAYDLELSLHPSRAAVPHEPEIARAVAVEPLPERAPAPMLPPATRLTDFEDDESEPEDAEYDGSRLQRLRERRGIEIDEIAGVTKVNPTYLRFLEEERFDDLPAAVYVRGFLKSYARCLGLDADRVARSYMRRYDERSSKRRRGLFSRRQP